MFKLIFPQKYIYPLISFITVLIIWESAVRLGAIKSVFLPAPSTVGLSLLKYYGYLGDSALITLGRVAMAYVIGAGLGITLGLVIGWYKQVDVWIRALLLIISPIPIITFLPLFIIWFGLGVTPIILCGIMAAFFPVLTATISGVKKVDPGYIEVARNFNKSPREILIKIIWPASLPYITNGLRTAIQFICLIVPVAEMVMGDIGLGGLIARGADLFKMELVILGQITLGLMGLILFKLFDLAERKYWLPWMRIKK